MRYNVYTFIHRGVSNIYFKKSLDALYNFISHGMYDRVKLQCLCELCDMKAQHTTKPQHPFLIWLPAGHSSAVQAEDKLLQILLHPPQQWLLL